MSEKHREVSKAVIAGHDSLETAFPKSLSRGSCFELYNATWSEPPREPQGRKAFGAQIIEYAQIVHLYGIVSRPIWLSRVLCILCEFHEFHLSRKEMQTLSGKKLYNVPDARNSWLPKYRKNPRTFSSTRAIAVTSAKHSLFTFGKLFSVQTEQFGCCIHFLPSSPPLLLGTEAVLPSPNEFSVPILMILSFCCGAVCAGLALRVQQNRQGELEARANSRQALAEISTLDEGEIRELFGELPSWLALNDFQRGGWLNKVVSAAWPYLDEATSNVIVNALDPILQATRPNFLTSLRFERFSFGSVPAKIEAVKVYESTGEGAVEIDLQVFWAGDPNVVLGVRAAQDTLSVPVSLTEIKCKFTLRLIFAPLIGKFPCFGALTIALTEEPEVVFDLRVVGGDITLVPGLAQPLRTYIKALISSYLVWPRCITVPIPGTGYSLPANERLEDLSGLLHVEVISHDALTNQPGELGLEVCWPGNIISQEEERVKALPGGRMFSSKPISLLVTDPRFQTLKLRWYSEQIDGENESNARGESAIVLEDLVRMSLYNEIAIADVSKSWGPITLAAELDPIVESTANINKVQGADISLKSRVFGIWDGTKSLFAVRRGKNSTEKGVYAVDKMENKTYDVQQGCAKIVQITLRYQALQSNSQSLPETLDDRYQSEISQSL